MFLIDFFMQIFLKSFIEFVTLLFFSARHVGILAPLAGIEPTYPALEGEVLTIGPPGKS